MSGGFELSPAWAFPILVAVALVLVAPGPQASGSQTELLDSEPESTPVVPARDEVAEAERALRSVLEADPDNRTARFNLAILLAREGGSSEALDLLRQLAAGEHPDLQVDLELAELLRREGHHEEALSYYERALTSDPLASRARFGYGAALVDVGRLEDAIESLEYGLRQHPSDGLVAHALARLLAAAPNEEQRDGERALSLANRVFAARPSATHAETMALALAELGRCGEAAEWQRRAIELVDEESVERRDSMRAMLGLFETGAVETGPVETGPAAEEQFDAAASDSSPPEERESCRPPFGE